MSKLADMTVTLKMDGDVAEAFEAMAQRVAALESQMAEVQRRHEDEDEDAQYRMELE